MAGRVCPWWLGYFHLGPIRRMLHNPEKILSPYVRRGMKVLDIGPGMGFFTLEMARLVGPEGMTVAIDLQPKMIRALERRAGRAGLADRIDARVCTAGDLGADDLAGSIDFSIGFYVVHEVPDVSRFMQQVYALLVPAGKFLVVEPENHISREDFELNIGTAREAGFSVIERPEIRKSFSVLLVKS
ncbi:MAG TPA: class I SAM-dependent methyltransferase [Patescibacteria group bacterium]|nr:class I SAM-dependent methyltransferase [Patescibacteria group bacterium]